MAQNKVSFEADRYDKIKKFPEPKNKDRMRAVSHPEKDVNILPTKRLRSAPTEEYRHNDFQFGTNPMTMTPFERELVDNEVYERKIARQNYVAGIQGRDGGSIPHEQNEEYFPDKF